MVTDATFIRVRESGIRGAAARIRAVMASISERGGVTLPTWFLSAITGALLVGTVSLISFEWNNSQIVREDHEAISRHEDAIKDLQSVKVDVARVQTKVDNLQDTAARIETKLDRLPDRHMPR